MLGMDGIPALSGLSGDIANVAEAVAVLVNAKLSETLKVMFAFEANRARADLRNALKELRHDCRQDDSEHVVEHLDDHTESNKPVKKQAPLYATLFARRTSTRSSIAVVPGPSCSTSTSSDSRRSPNRFPMRARTSKVRMQSVDLEKHLAERVINSKLLNVSDGLECNGSSSSNLCQRPTVDNLEGQGSTSTGGVRRQVSFQQVVPVNNQHEILEDDAEITSASLCKVRNSKKVGSPSPEQGRQITFQEVEELAVEDPVTNEQSHGSSGSLHSISQKSHLQSTRDTESQPDGQDKMLSTRELTPSPSGVTRSTSISSRIHRLSLLSMGSSATLTRWKVEARKFYDHKHSSDGESWGPAKRINSTVSCALGLLPWDFKFVWFSRAYQFCFLLILLLSTLSVVLNFATSSVDRRAKEVSIYIDAIVAIGSLLVFLVTFLKNKAYVESQFLVESYISRSGFLEELHFKTFVEHCAMLTVWLSCAGSRFYVHATELNLHDLGFMFTVLVLLGTCAYGLRLCEGLHFIVDSFCQYMSENDFDFEDAMQEWFLLHCTIRTACASLQWCFVIFQLIAICIVLVVASSIYMGHTVLEDVTIVTCVPGALCLVALFRLCIRAALVSDLCRRVPMLVNSAKAEFDLKRMYLVNYIVHCETGFYIFEVRLSSAMILKTFYIACAGVVGLLTQVLRQLS